MGRTFTKLVHISCLLVPLAISAGCASSDSGTVIERYRAHAISMGSAATGAKTTVQIGVFRWSTDEERANFVSILKNKGPAALNEAMFESEEVAFVKFGSSLGYRIHYARELRGGDGRRHLLFATDRPINIRETRRNSRTKDYDFSIIELTLDETGKGDGAIAVGVDVGVNETTGVLELENYSSEPVRLLDVTRVD